MNRQSWLLNLSLLKTHPAFRAVFIARFISILSLGLLGVAIPVQIQMMTHSTWQVGLSVTLTGASMFVGLMVGGVLADRYERKRLMDPQVVWGPWVGELEVFSQNCAHVDIISPQAFEAIGPVVREILG